MDCFMTTGADKSFGVYTGFVLATAMAAPNKPMTTRVCFESGHSRLWESAGVHGEYPSMWQPCKIYRNLTTRVIPVDLC